jgi:hypothetical protein
MSFIKGLVVRWEEGKGHLTGHFQVISLYTAYRLSNVFRKGEKKIKGFRPRGTVHVCLRDSVCPSYFLRDKKKQNGDEPKKIAKNTRHPPTTQQQRQQQQQQQQRRPKMVKKLLKATPFFAVYNDAPKPNEINSYFFLFSSSSLSFFLSIPCVCVCVL